MTNTSNPEQLPQCERDESCERPASESVYSHPEDKSYVVCRPHRREINRLNAKHIGCCQFGNCPNFPTTMRYWEGDDLAVCLKHNSHIDQAYATLRAKHAV